MKIKCDVSNCEVAAIGLFGANWVCGKHMTQLLIKEKERKNKMVEELE